MSDAITVEVVFALADKQELLTVSLPAGATAQDAIERSGILERFASINTRELPIGIWGRVVGRDACLEDGDRVEIYRPLEIDPREARRRLALAGRTMGQDEED